MTTNECEIGKNIWYTALSIVLPSIFTFLFWLIAARFGGPEAIGVGSTLASVSLIISNFVLFDVQYGMKRTLAIALSEKDTGKFKQIFLMVNAVVLFFSVMIILLISLMGEQFEEYTGLDNEYIMVICLLFPSMAFQYLYIEVLITLFESRKLLFPVVIGSIGRFPIFFFLLYTIDLPIIGTTIAYISLFIISVLWYAFSLYKIIRHYPFNLKNLYSNLSEVFLSGFSSWIPHIINILGSQLSLIGVYSIHGAEEAGKFYLPLAIFTLALFVVSGINKVSHPLIASMKNSEQQKNFLLKSMKMAFIITMPFGSILFFYSTNILSLLGQSYETSGITLSVFMLGLPLAIFTEMIYYFVYALGKRRMLILLGVSGNFPRIVLYFLLIPIFDSVGAALGYLIGSFIQFILSLVVVKVLSIQLPSLRYLAIVGLPFLSGAVIKLFDVHFMISIPLVLLMSWFFYIKFNLISEGELEKII
ncbi:MAG: hypothetical protein L0H53_13425, partial [Candidatus Nitrosocosmicus sp.]|nr:hypothetical protein [Candidatus Nitrosocosmicus sp.]